MSHRYSSVIYMTSTTTHTNCETCEALSEHSAIMVEQSGAFEWTSTEGDHSATVTEGEEA